METSIPLPHSSLLPLWNTNRESMSIDRSGPERIGVVIKDGAETRTFTVQVQLGALLMSAGARAITQCISIISETHV